MTKKIILYFVIYSMSPFLWANQSMSDVPKEPNIVSTDISDTSNQEEELTDKNTSDTNRSIEISVEPSNGNVFKELNEKLDIIIENQKQIQNEPNEIIQYECEPYGEGDYKWYERWFEKHSSIVEVFQFTFAFIIGIICLYILSHTSRRFRKIIPTIKHDYNSDKAKILFENIVLHFILLYTLLLSWGLISELFVMPLEFLNRNVLGDSKILGFVIRRIYLTGRIIILCTVCFPLLRAVKFALKNQPKEK